MSYAYHAVSSYFNRDNVALPGFVSYFRDASIEERDHAQMLMDFQVTCSLHGVFQLTANGMFVVLNL